MFSELNPRVRSVSAGRTCVYCGTPNAVIFPTASTSNGMQSLIGYDTIWSDDLACWDQANFCYRVKKPGWYFVRNGIRANQSTSMEVLIAWTSDKSYIYKTACTSTPFVAIAGSPVGVSFSSAASSSMWFANAGDIFVPTAYSPALLTQHSIYSPHYGFTVVGPF